MILKITKSSRLHHLLLRFILLTVCICITANLRDAIKTCNAQQQAHQSDYMDLGWAKIPKDNFLQLTRNRIIASPCKLDRFHLNQRTANISAEEPSSQQVMKCNISELVSVVSLSDTVPIIGHDHNSSHSDDLINAICKSRIQVIKRRAENATSSSTTQQVASRGDNAVEANGFWQPDMTTDETHFESACNNLVRLEIDILKNTQKLCSGQRSCNISHPIDVDSFKDCIQISNYDLVPIFQLNFLCLPEDFVFYLTRVVKFTDLDNTISCPTEKLLYIRRTNYSLGSSSKWDFLPRSENHFDDTYEDEKRSLPVENLNHLVSMKNSETEKLCEVMNIIPRLIITKCHTTPKCSLNLGRIIRKLLQTNPCSLTKDRLSTSYATISYVCMPKIKFQESEFSRFVETDRISSGVIGDNQTYATNNIDYDLEFEFQTELGSRKMSQIAFQMSTSATPGILNTQLSSSRLMKSIIFLVVGYQVKRIWFP